MSNNVNKPGLVFDIGAYRGDKTKSYLMQGHTVVSFEPNPIYAEKLRRRFKKNVTVVEKAVGSFDGLVKLLICSSAGTLSTCTPLWKTGRFARHKWDKEIDVEQTTLNTAIAEYGKPTFIKIDVEGYEYEVLKGLSSPVCALSFEFVSEFKSALSKCIDRLVDLGYQQFSFKKAKQPDLYIPWGGHLKTVEALSELPKGTWGDVYAR